MEWLALALVLCTGAVVYTIDKIIDNWSKINHFHLIHTYEEIHTDVGDEEAEKYNEEVLKDLNEVKTLAEVLYEEGGE